MRKLIMWNVITLDGCFEGKEKWDLQHHQLVWGSELEAFSIAQLKTADMLVFGRVTYEGMAEYWQKVEGEEEVATYMNSIPKLVCSTTLQHADWHNTTIAKDAVSEITTLKQQGEGNLYVFGSGDLSASLMKAQLFDEYRLVIVPVLLDGRRLFHQGIPRETLTLLESRKLSNGGLILRYAPKRDYVSLT